MITLHWTKKLMTGGTPGSFAPDGTECRKQSSVPIVFGDYVCRNQTRVGHMQGGLNPYSIYLDLLW